MATRRIYPTTEARQAAERRIGSYVRAVLGAAGEATVRLAQTQPDGYTGSLDITVEGPVAALETLRTQFPKLGLRISGRCYSPGHFEQTTRLYVEGIAPQRRLS